MKENVKKQLKCQVCSTKEIPIYGNRSEMIKEKEGYVHLINCHKIYLDEKIKKENDAPHWSALFEYLKELHGVITIPSRNIKRLHALREGSDIKEGKTYQRYRRGISYDLMLEAYIAADEKIRWFKDNILKGGNTPQDINSCITVMLDNGLNKAWENRQIEKKKIEQEFKIKNEIYDNYVGVMNDFKQSKKKKDEMDISNLL